MASQVDVSLTMIVRDCARLMPACLGSVADVVDEVVLVDTGSVDDTVDVSSKVLKQHGVPLVVIEAGPDERPDLFLDDSASLGEKLGIPGPFSGEPMLANYGEARQLGWEACRSEVVMWLDSDDVLEDALSVGSVAASVLDEGLGAAMLWYEYSRSDDGRVTCLMQRERIARRGGRWHHPIHEILVPDGPTRTFESPRVVHRRHGWAGHVVHWRNLKIMLWQVATAKEKGEAVDPRTLFRLGSELRMLDKTKAFEHLEEYCRRSGWAAERALARIKMGEIREELGDQDAAFVQYAAAAAEDPRSPEAHAGLMRSCYSVQRHHEASEHGLHALTLARELRSGELLEHDPTARLVATPRYLVLSLIVAGRYAEAAKTAREAIPRETDAAQKKNLEWNLALAEARVRETSAPTPRSVPRKKSDASTLALLAVEVWRHLVAERNFDDARTFLSNLTATASQHPLVKAAIARTPG